MNVITTKVAVDVDGNVEVYMLSNQEPNNKIDACIRFSNTGDNGDWSNYAARTTDGNWNGYISSTTHMKLGKLIKNEEVFHDSEYIYCTLVDVIFRHKFDFRKMREEPTPQSVIKCIPINLLLVAAMLDSPESEFTPEQYKIDSDCKLVRSDTKLLQFNSYIRVSAINHPDWIMHVNKERDVTTRQNLSFDSIEAEIIDMLLRYDKFTSRITNSSLLIAFDKIYRKSYPNSNQVINIIEPNIRTARMVYSTLDTEMCTPIVIFWEAPDKTVTSIFDSSKLDMEFVQILEESAIVANINR